MERKKKKGIEPLLKLMLFLVLCLGMYWSILLTFIATKQLLDDIQILNTVFYLLILTLPVMMIWTANYYRTVLKKETLTKRWGNWYKKEHDQILFTVASTLVLEILILGFVKDVFVFSESFVPVIGLAAFPTALGETLVMIVRTQTDQLLPVIQIINETGVLIGVGFQLVAFYYLAKFLLWVPHFHKKN